MLNRRVFAVVYSLAALGMGVGLVSCNNSDTAVQPAAAQSKAQSAAGHPKAAEVKPAGLHHWIQHAELRTLMAQIEEARKKTVNTVATGDAATLHSDAHRDYLAASEAAKRLAISAKQISKSAAEVQMTEEDRKTFGEQADALRNEARKFSIIARRRRSDLIEERMQALEAACVSCHTKFRDLAGEWQPPGA